MTPSSSLPTTTTAAPAHAACGATTGAAARAATTGAASAHDDTLAAQRPTLPLRPPYHHKRWNRLTVELPGSDDKSARTRAPLVPWEDRGCGGPLTAAYRLVTFVVMGGAQREGVTCVLRQQRSWSSSRALSSTATALAALAFIVMLAASGAARAQVFSPGDLSKGHKELDGLATCTKCHGDGNQHDNGKCLECHKEIARTLDAELGYHRTVANAQKCAECHREHRGRNAKLVEWVPSKENWNHNLTGWPLKGAHKKNECNKCHELRRIQDDDIRKIVNKEGRETYLGLSERCTTCHFDEHRGQEGGNCEKCHSTDEFKKAPGFNHNDKKDTDFPLVGNHRKVQCRNCHEPLVDTKTPDDAFPAPIDAVYMQLKDIPHAQCVACHDDFHRGNFGKSCDRCHTPEGWRTIKETGQDTGFHDKHAYKLRGEHQSVACRSCHGPFPGQPAKFKGLKFKLCADCHADAHSGQIAADISLGTGNIVKCETCHTVGGFVPVLFDVVLHDKTRFRLEASHRAVSCTLCHKPDPRVRARFPAKIRAELESKGRRVLISDARFDMPDVVGDALADKEDAAQGGAAATNAPPADCHGCHDDIHQGQFAKPAGKDGDKLKVDKKACATCHQSTQFADLAKFNHDDSRFPLEGKHKEVWCAGCHEAPKTGPMKGVVMYRPVPPECQSCHADEHVGQMAKDGLTACGDCHGFDDFKTTAKFDHDKQSRYPLNGAHENVKCYGCHQYVEVKPGKKIAQYKPLPMDCADCHIDEHKGSFDDFNPRVPPPSMGAMWRPPAADATTTTTTTAPAGVEGTGEPAAKLAQKSAKKDAKVVKLSPAEEAALAEKKLKGCDGCHIEETWQRSKFAHERTGFALSGRHAITRCASCHASDFQRPLPATCAGCHVDPHAQEFGMMCAACHTTQGFAGPPFPVDSHRRTNFPLTGRHAALPCDECHVEKRDKTFTRAALDCNACHARDATRATTVTVNHQTPPFNNVGCRSCHNPVAFSPATYVQHDVCFPVSRGKHAPFTCAECHVAAELPGSVADGTCNGPQTTCTLCHFHNEADELDRHVTNPEGGVPVPGYEFKSPKCTACHRTVGLPP